MKKIYFMAMAIIFVGSILFFNGPASVMAAEKPKYGGILKFNHGKQAGIIGDPLKIRMWNHEFIDNTLQTLIRPKNKEMGAFEPLLAESWELAPDKSHYIFKLRKGVKFHDGTDFNAQAVKWNLDRWVKSKRPRLDKVKSVDVIDDYTVRCNLSGWDAVVLFDFAKDTYIISPTAFEKHGEKWANYNPVGTGPFKLTYYKRATLLKYKKFEDYWKEGLPYLDEIHVVQIPDPMTYSASLQRGEVDALMGVDFITASELRKKGKFIININRGGTQLLQFNSEDQNSIWANRKARQALEYAVDKQKITKAVGRGFLIPVYEIVCMIPPGAGTTPRKYDPEKARQLLKEAGFPKGIKVKLTYAASPIGKDIVVVLQDNLAAVGIQIVPNPLSPAAFSQVSHRPAPPNDLILGGQRGGANELLASVDETLAPGSVFFPAMKRPEGFVDLLHKALQTMDFDETMQYLYKMERLAYEDAFFAPLWRGGLITVQHPYVKDAIWFWGSMPYPNLEGAWLDR